MLPSLRLLAKFKDYSDQMPQPTDEMVCWNWMRSVNSNGYGKLTLWRVGTFYAHRVAYGIEHGYVPDELDHLCRNPLCWRPSHLEPVNHRENCRRSPFFKGDRDHCEAGHEYAVVGYWLQANGRKCKACHRIRSMESYRRKRDRGYRIPRT